MNTYIAFFKNKKIEVKADTSYQAQTLAAKQLKVKKQYEITVVLSLLDNKEVVHKAVD